jgi:hypothetical protein
MSGDRAPLMVLMDMLVCGVCAYGLVQKKNMYKQTSLRISINVLVIARRRRTKTYFLALEMRYTFYYISYIRCMLIQFMRFFLYIIRKSTFTILLESPKVILARILILCTNRQQPKPGALFFVNLSVFSNNKF